MSPLPLLLAIQGVLAIDREDVLDNAAIFTTHEWTMGSENQYASCSSDYVSDWTPGQTYQGIPYDWGGWVTTDEYDDDLAAGYGAGSHSWHGVLWCTTGVDCSGFVSQAWETDQKYGTATFYQVTSEISISELERGDALNNAGSHIVLFAYETAAGIPVHYEANGDLVFVDSDQGWSSFGSYEAVRYEDISDGAETGTASNPIEIESFPFEDLGWTAGAASDVIDSYICAPSTDESGPEQLYRFQVAVGGTLDLRVSDDSGVDIDIHVLSSASGDGCLRRDDAEISMWLEPGEYWIAADTYVGSYEYPGPYLLTASFDGELGDLKEDDEDPVDTGDSGISDEEPDDGDTGQGDLGSQGAQDDPLSPPPGERLLMSSMDEGCGCGAAQASGGLLLGLLALCGRRRRH